MEIRTKLLWQLRNRCKFALCLWLAISATASAGIMEDLAALDANFDPVTYEAFIAMQPPSIQRMLRAAPLVEMPTNIAGNCGLHAIFDYLNMNGVAARPIVHFDGMSYNDVTATLNRMAQEPELSFLQGHLNRTTWISNSNPIDVADTRRYLESLIPPNHAALIGYTTVQGGMHSGHMLSARNHNGQLHIFQTGWGDDSMSILRSSFADLPFAAPQAREHLNVLVLPVASDPITHLNFVPTVSRETVPGAPAATKPEQFLVNILDPNSGKIGYIVPPQKTTWYQRLWNKIARRVGGGGTRLAVNRGIGKKVGNLCGSAAKHIPAVDVAFAVPDALNVWSTETLAERPAAEKWTNVIGVPAAAAVLPHGNVMGMYESYNWIQQNGATLQYDPATRTYYLDGKRYVSSGGDYVEVGQTPEVFLGRLARWVTFSPFR